MSRPHNTRDEPSSKLNLFRFKRKTSSTQATTTPKTVRSPSQGAQDPLAHDDAGAATAAPAMANPDSKERLRIDTTETDDSYPPESFVSSQDEMVSPSESSLIFERSVEDPIQVYQPTQCPRCGRKSSSSGLKCNHQSIVNLPSHYSVENFVSPCLDATTKILTDENADLENVDMVYSRRPSSVLGLNMALGRTRSSVGAEMLQSSPPKPVAKTHSMANMKDLDPSSPSSPNGAAMQRPPMLSFYSYADMINSENPNPRRPSISQSLSSSFLASRSNSMSVAGTSITPQRTPANARQSFSSSPFTAPGRQLMQQRTNSMSRPATNTMMSPSSSIPQGKKFTLNMDTSPNSSDSESDYSHARKGSVSSSRKLSQTRLLNRSLSNQSSLLGSPMTPGRRYSNLDEACFDASDNESLVVNSVGETLRRNNGEIQSSNNSIIA